MNFQSYISCSRVYRLRFYVQKFFLFLSKTSKSKTVLKYNFKFTYTEVGKESANLLVQNLLHADSTAAIFIWLYKTKISYSKICTRDFIELESSRFVSNMSSPKLYFAQKKNIEKNYVTLLKCYLKASLFQFFFALFLFPKNYFFLTY